MLLQAGFNHMTICAHMPSMLAHKRNYISLSALTKYNINGIICIISVEIGFAFNQDNKCFVFIYFNTK